MNVIVSPPGMTLVADHAHEHDPAASALSGRIPGSCSPSAGHQ